MLEIRGDLIDRVNKKVSVLSSTFLLGRSQGAGGGDEKAREKEGPYRSVDTPLIKRD